uniref:Putative restriction endonuclease domain-containing protein n=1 Tax=Cyanothece sp. (strain PCC 7425 / ATCC 29141) TaxID=395961 RepID=B8HT44_CYAP4
MDTAVNLHRLTVQDYHRMIEAGILTPEQHIELLDGLLIQMVAKGTPHRATISRIGEQLRLRLQDRALICYQDPVQLDDYSEPEPDISILKPDPLFYEEHHPRPADVFWLIEVADTTLKYDCETKAFYYARSGITELWVVDLKGRKFHIYRFPGAEGYSSETILAEDQCIAPLAFPDCQLLIRDLLPIRR